MIEKAYCLNWSSFSSGKAVPDLWLSNASTPAESGEPKIALRLFRHVPNQAVFCAASTVSSDAITPRHAGKASNTKKM